MLPVRMPAIGIEGGVGPAESLKVVKVDVPNPAPGESLIRVQAAGINRPDIAQRLGLYPPPLGAPLTLGLEAAGEVAALGRDVKRWQVGDGVTALLGGGGYAEFVAVDEGHALPIPAGMSFIDAASLPETVFPVFANAIEHGRLCADETLLIHGGTSGIGVMATQMAKALGARVITTGRGAEKAAASKAFGADIAINSHAEDFVEVVGNVGGADVVLDMIGGSYFSKNLDAMSVGGRLVQIAFQDGAIVELPIFKLMQKRLIVTGSTLRSRDAVEKARLAREIERIVWPLLEAGKIRTVIDRMFPLGEASLAHARLEAGAHIGKVMLAI